MIDDRQPHDRGQADGGLHVVGEDQEGAAERPDPAVRRDPVETRGHAVLPHAPVELPPRRRRPERPTLLEGGAGAAAQIGRAADQVGDRGGDRLEREAGGLPGGELAARGRDHRQRLVPRLGQSPCHPPPELGRMLRILARSRRPSAPANPPAPPRPAPARFASAPAHPRGRKTRAPWASRGSPWSAGPPPRQAGRRAPPRCSAWSAPDRR